MSDDVIHTNDKGGKQHLVKYSYHLMPAQVVKDVAATLYNGAIDYGEWNWINIPMLDHINHATSHLQNVLVECQEISGTIQVYEEINHAICRTMFAAHMCRRENFI